MCLTLSALFVACLLAPVSLLGQSHSINGKIEGFAVDVSGSAVAGAEITAINVDTGGVRSTRSNEAGLYRFPLLTLGTYHISAQAAGFKQFRHEGIGVSAGQTTTVNVRLEPGDVNESVTVSADAPIADAGRTDLGRTMNEREVHNLPLPTRNPFNFVILQANVTGRPNRGFNFPQINVNGFARRVNYLFDGNTNTQGDRAGARLMMMSEVFVQEARIITNGFAAEFGNTTGMIMNIVTPSGTNDFKGAVGYFFRHPTFYARPFFFSAASLPDNSTTNFTAAVGGPIAKDRWHFYSGFEFIDRDDSTRSNRQVTISDSNRTELIAAGLSASIFVPAIPSKEKARHFIFRTDGQLNPNNSLSARYNRTDAGNENSIGGGFNTLERSVDTASWDYSLGAQLVSFGLRYLNELRFQYAFRHVENRRNESSGTGPSVSISNVVNFGSPVDANSIFPLTTVTQIQDNLTWTHGDHAFKLGGGFSYQEVYNRSNVFSLYTFSTIAAYAVAKIGAAPFGYTRYDESFGDPETRSKTTYWNLFAQDSWKATPRLNVNYGIRYDLYVVSEADPTSLFPASRKFAIDKNNISPRLGIVLTLREGNRPSVLRGGAGIYYEPPFSDMYERARLNNGTPKFYSIRFCPSADQCQIGPAFPNTYSGSRPPGSALPPQDIITIAPDFENMYAVHANVQLEQALTEDLSLAVGYVHSAGRHIPVYRNINSINPVATLADGRPIFSSISNSTTRLDPRFDTIEIAESVAVSRYDALTLQLTQRYSRGLQFSANYTLSKAVDDAPEQNVTYAIGGGAATSFVLSDPTNRIHDRGYSYGDQRHTFVMSMVARPDFGVRDRALSYILKNNQYGIIATANSGERFTITAGRDVNGSLSPLDLNLDGLSFSDRPVGIKRNSGKTPPQFNLDLRYSRFVPISDRYRLEFLVEVQNLFNINNIVAYTNLLVPTDPVTGELIGQLPDFKERNTSQSLESRQAHLGVKFYF